MTAQTQSQLHHNNGKPSEPLLLTDERIVSLLWDTLKVRKAKKQGRDGLYKGQHFYRVNPETIAEHLCDRYTFGFNVSLDGMVNMLGVEIDSHWHSIKTY